MMPTAPPSAYDDDETIALEMYRQQHLQQQQQQQQQSNQSIYSTTRTTPTMYSNTTPPLSRMDDEAVARALQQEEQDAQFARDMEEQIRREQQLQQTTATSERDVQYALQVEQQLRDEELARQYAAAEEAALQHQQQQAVAAQRNSAGASSRRRFWSCIVPCLIVGVGVVIWWFVFNNNGSGGISLPGLGEGGGGVGIPWLQDNDPFEGMQPGEVAKWYNGRDNDGLQLTVINAMQERWDDVFPLVLNDWDNGTPDTLALTVENESPDPNCNTVPGKSKVCNGNYGNTQWKGINMVILQNGFIASSASKMNEFYLARASTSQRRYTLCHELGHSFGLPHTDENFYNRDLGNCMDYTSNPAVNQQPDETNYQFLKELYGVLPSWAAQTEAPTDAPSNLRRSRILESEDLITPPPTSSTSTTNMAAAFPDHIQTKIQEIVQHQNHTPEQLQRQGWRLLHTSQHGQAHELQLGDGWSVQMHKLLHIME